MPDYWSHQIGQSCSIFKLIQMKINCLHLIVLILMFAKHVVHFNFHKLLRRKKQAMIFFIFLCIYYIEIFNTECLVTFFSFLIVSYLIK